MRTTGAREDWNREHRARERQRHTITLAVVALCRDGDVGGGEERVFSQSVPKTFTIAPLGSLGALSPAHSGGLRLGPMLDGVSSNVSCP